MKNKNQMYILVHMASMQIPLQVWHKFGSSTSAFIRYQNSLRELTIDSTMRIWRIIAKHSLNYYNQELTSGDWTEILSWNALTSTRENSSQTFKLPWEIKCLGFLKQIYLSLVWPKKYYQSKKLLCRNPNSFCLQQLHLRDHKPKFLRSNLSPSLIPWFF